MDSTRDHIRKNFLTGMFAAIPVAVTLFIIYWINAQTQPITHWIFRRDIPFLGLILALITIYLIGMGANSLLGRFVLRRIDHLIGRLPVVSQIYLAWKQVALTPGGTEGTFSKVVLIPDETGFMKWMGFTSGRLIEGSEPMYCVFVPNSPNPITGRLYFVPIDKCTMLAMSVEEAFKLILSTGNYVPPLRGAVALVSDESGSGDQAQIIHDHKVLTESKG
jgi:uncharacterized membrane protein